MPTVICQQCANTTTVAFRRGFRLATIGCPTCGATKLHLPHKDTANVNAGRRYEHCTRCQRRGLNLTHPAWPWEPKYVQAGPFPAGTPACRVEEPVPATGRIRHRDVHDAVVAVLGPRQRWASNDEEQHLHTTAAPLPDTCPVCTPAGPGWNSGFFHQAYRFAGGLALLAVCESCHHTILRAALADRPDGPPAPVAAPTIPAPDPGRIPPLMPTGTDQLTLLEEVTAATGPDATAPDAAEYQRRIALLIDALDTAARDNANAAEAGIGLYREYVEQHGYAEDNAAVAAAVEVQRGTEALLDVPAPPWTALYRCVTGYAFEPTCDGGNRLPVEARRRRDGAWIIVWNGSVATRDGTGWDTLRPEAEAPASYLAATGYTREQAVSRARLLAAVPDPAAAGHYDPTRPGSRQ